MNWKKWIRILFPLPFWAEVPVFAACCAGLVWVFVKGMEQWWPAYFLYALSAYSLTALCVRLPGAVKREKAWVKNHPKIAHILKNKELHFLIELYFEQFLNFAYGFFKIASGVIVGSAWIGADGI